MKIKRKSIKQAVDVLGKSEDEDSVIALLGAAFPVEPYRSSPFGTGGSSYDGSIEFWKAVQGETWSSVDPSLCEQFYDAFHFVIPSEFCRYLPAFVVAAVREFEEVPRLCQEVVFGLIRDADDPEAAAMFDAKVEGLHAEQRQATASALQYLAARIRDAQDDTFGEWVDARDNDATKALDSYWSEYLP